MQEQQSSEPAAQTAIEQAQAGTAGPTSDAKAEMSAIAMVLASKRLQLRLERW